MHLVLLCGRTILYFWSCSWKSDNKERTFEDVPGISSTISQWYLYRVQRDGNRATVKHNFKLYSGAEYGVKKDSFSFEFLLN